MLHTQPTARAQGRNQPKNSKISCTVFLLCLAAAITAQAQKFTTLASFNGSNGNQPNALIQGTDGNFYGTTVSGGANSSGTFCTIGTGCGEVFRVNPTGTITLLYSFCEQSNCSDGSNPEAGLAQDAEGDLYGTAAFGGVSPGLLGCGTIFRMTQEGVITFLRQLQVSGGCSPNGALVLSTYAGSFYGTTYDGGINDGGTIFKLGRRGAFYDLYNAIPLDVASLAVGALTEGNNGNFYGATQSHLGGGVFMVTPGGRVTGFDLGTEPNFNPNGTLALGSDGNFYGTTIGDPDVSGVSYCCGTVFRLTPTGGVKTLHIFCQSSSCEDGLSPSSLVQGTDGNFYGTTSSGGSESNGGTIFKITPGGKLTTLHLFCMQTNCADGGNSSAGLIQGTDGKFYGVAGTGGTNDLGTVFSLDVGLKPFVKALLNSGVVGTKVLILGNELNGSTAVKFNGTAAAFTVVSDTEITTTVPKGATSGNITVMTQSGTLASNVTFRVTPQVLGFSPTNGPVGTSVVITGESFTGAIHVHFGSVEAVSFTVDSDTQITAIVPPGTTSGDISVCTAGGSGYSRTAFTAK
jgi:uncharacterized repeat protein (TIGR03803 family)